MRMVERRSFSEARMAAFMSSVMRSLSVTDGRSVPRARSREVAHAALLVTLHRGSLLALALLGGLLVEFAAPKLRKHARLLAGALEAAQGGIEILVLANANAGHRNLVDQSGLGARPRPLVALPGKRTANFKDRGEELQSMRILWLETSCDETAVAVYDGRQGLLAHEVYSQVALHAAYGGVVPELASRDHLRKLSPLLRKVLAEAGGAATIDGVAYTAGPGLVGALLVGAAARSLAFAWRVPYRVHHMEGTCSPAVRARTA
jgi:hypothetical protein